MASIPETTTQLEVHDPEILAHAREVLDACGGARQMAEEVLAVVKRNEEWRGKQCINLLAPEAPTTPMVRALLSSEIGTRAAEGNIGAVNRWFAGTKYIDEVESLCVELLKKAFRCNYADHRLMGSMLGNMAVYQTLTQPGDTIMSVAGMRGLDIVDVPFDPTELEVNVDAFRELARKVQPKIVALGMSMTLFPYPVEDMAATAAEWGGRIFFDGAHQAGLIAGGQFQDPLREGAAVLTGSAGKTFAGPQSGMMMWNDPALTKPLTDAVFPVLAATHQVNRVAALAVAAAEMLAFGAQFMAHIVKNAQALAAALDQRGIPMLGQHKGYTRTHQAIANVSQFGGGMNVAHRLARANIITNKNLLPDDTPADWDRPRGLRMGTIEVTRLGMGAAQMDMIADFIARILINGEEPEHVAGEVVEFRAPYQTLYYSFEAGFPRPAI